MQKKSKLKYRIVKDFQTNLAFLRPNLFYTIASIFRAVAAGHQISLGVFLSSLCLLNISQFSGKKKRKILSSFFTFVSFSRFQVATHNLILLGCSKVLRFNNSFVVFANPGENLEKRSFKELRG